MSDDKDLIEQLVISPCISICKIDTDTGYCEGCFRTLKEVNDWPKYDREERLNLLNDLRARRDEHGDGPKRKKRRNRRFRYPI